VPPQRCDDSLDGPSARRIGSMPRKIAERVDCGWSAARLATLMFCHRQSRPSKHAKPATRRMLYGSIAGARAHGGDHSVVGARARRKRPALHVGRVRIKVAEASQQLVVCQKHRVTHRCERCGDLSLTHVKRCRCVAARAAVRVVVR
jgi:hypothetical protein